MKVRLLALGLVTLITANLWSQDSEQNNVDLSGFKCNVVYVEGFIMNPSAYNFGYPSINYERYFDKLYRLSFRIGVSSDFKTTTNIPFSINWLTASQKHHHLEFGAGAIISFNDYTYENNNIVAYGIFIPVMYRYQKADGIVVRAGINGVFGLDHFIAPSVSLGYNF
ncbi:hypothetical protein KEM09_12440 [Carboxylicivirga mesophila]|uniref:DUF3575 domain-containing protein n=1 Tax=Carboxylicivirga mesophila TaxID=1166478 RepID=A0ABS5KB14_9BACT|nr:hypothetical protein [Carboxylicivirga mesophila]MBS2212218.1 hypothetical protein [Carboxylicivirga mesophila]